MFEHPDKYPMTPVKVPIENPYYVPKPVSLESLNNQTTMSSTNKSKNSTIVKVTQKPPAKIFWLKKSFRNPVVNKEDSENREAEDLERWPRKKAVVSFTNEIFVEEIKDLHDKSTSNLANFMHDVTDLYKFISPRQRRGKI